MVGDSESSSLGIDESYIQSDIADIIKKMYTPRCEMFENTLSDVSCSIVEEKVTSNREILWRENESKRKFGYYFETETRNQLRQLLDSSSSGSVSLPSIRHKASRSGTYACRCCRRKISNRLTSKRVSSTCGNCKGCTNVIPPQTIRGNCILDNVEHFTREDNSLTVRPAQILPANEIDKVVKKPIEVLNESYKDKEYKASEVKISIENPSQAPQKLIHTEEAKPIQIKKQSSSFISRMFPVSWLGTDKKVKSKTDVEGKCKKPDNSAVKRSQKVDLNQHQLELGGQMPSTGQNKHTCESLKSAKKKRRGSRNLAEMADEINSILGDDCKLDLQNRVPSGEDQLKAVDCERLSDKCGEVLKKNSFDSQRPLVENSKLAADNRENFLRHEEDTVDEPKAGLKNKDSVSFKTIAEEPTCRLEISDQRTSDDIDTEWASRFWARIFGHCHLVLAFVTAFALQLVGLALAGLVRPLVWGGLQLACDHLLKPALAVLFDGLLQPLLRLLQRTAASARDVARPLAEAMGFFVAELARLLAACRLVEVHAPPAKVAAE